MAILEDKRVGAIIGVMIGKDLWLSQLLFLAHVLSFDKGSQMGEHKLKEWHIFIVLQ